ncbi:MAG: histidine kinase N-terminal 7TM domain-containing protein [Anaerolineae bacterium]
MVELDLVWLLSGLDKGLAAAILLTAFSLLVYVISHNVFSPVGRAFAALVAFITVVYVGDVAVGNVAGSADVARWLRFQWLGIAFVPAAYLHLSYALLHAVNNGAPGGRYAVATSYLLGLIFLILTLATDLLVWDGVYSPAAAHLKAGPLFWLFALYFAGTTVLGAVNVSVARQRAVTRASRRRLTYLALSFAAPTLGVFPFLIVAGIPGDGAVWLISALSALANTAVLLMLVVMAYSVAYYGVLAPERVVKQSFIEYLVRGPFVGTCVLAVMSAVPAGVQILGLTRQAFLVFAVVGVIVLLQVLISAARPLLDYLAYRQDRAEVAWLRELERRLLTTSDFRRILENVLISACDLWRAEGGFVASLPQGDMGELKVQAAIGAACDIPELPDVAEWLQGQCRAWQERQDSDAQLLADDLLPVDGCLLVALLSRDDGTPLGVLGLRSRLAPADASADELELLGIMAHEAAAAIEDLCLQRQVFGALKRLLPEIESVQRWQGDATYGQASAILANPVLSSEFPSLVRAALRHYWGGPELRESPLLQLRVVRQAMRENEGNPIKALRAVLVKAIEALRPPGSRDISPDWLLYNVLEMKYVQGLKAREIARRLAVSESDLYRKQRVAVGEVARVLLEMELQAAKAGG